MEYTNKSFSVGQTTNKCDRCKNNKTDICDTCNFFYDKFIEKCEYCRHFWYEQTPAGRDIRVVCGESLPCKIHDTNV